MKSCLYRALTTGAFISMSTCTVTSTASAAPPTQTVGERQILAHADRQAPALAVARARSRLAEAAMQGASALLPEDPTLSAAAGPRLSSSSGETSVDWEVSLEQRFEIAGERGLRIAAAHRTRERHEAELRVARWRVHRQVHRAFHLALLAKRRLEVHRYLQASAERLLGVARRRRKAGDISDLQVSLAEGEVALARQGSVRALGRYRAACLRLARLAGWPPGSPPEPSGALEQPRTIEGAERLVQRTLRRHPDLGALNAALLEARAELTLARREVAPKPVLGLSVGREAEGAGEVNTIVLGTLSLPLPLWQRNRRRSAEANARVQVARARQRAARQTLRNRLLAAIGRMNGAAQRAAIFGREVLPSFSRNLRLLRRAFEEGKVDTVQVLVARGRMLSTQLAALDAHEDYFNARSELELALGDEVPTADSRKEHHHE